jgi:hypothetical protein
LASRGSFNREIFDDRYEVCRSDRDSETSSKIEGVAVKKSDRFSIISHIDWQTKIVEFLWFTLKPTDKSASIHINFSYLPDYKCINVNEEFSEAITNRVNSIPSDTFIVIGDFNVPSFDPPAPAPPCKKVECLIEMMQMSNLMQFNSVRSEADSRNLLDLVFSNSFLTV